MITIEHGTVLYDKLYLILKLCVHSNSIPNFINRRKITVFERKYKLNDLQLAATMVDYYSLVRDIPFQADKISLNLEKTDLDILSDIWRIIKDNKILQDEIKISSHTIQKLLDITKDKKPDFSPNPGPTPITYKIDSNTAADLLKQLNDNIGEKLSGDLIQKINDLLS